MARNMNETAVVSGSTTREKNTKNGMIEYISEEKIAACLECSFNDIK